MKKLLTAAIVATLFFAASSSAKADFFDWNSSGVLSIEDSRNDFINTDLRSGDITKVSYGSDEGFHYFRMDLQKSPDHNFLYEIYINSDQSSASGYEYSIDGSTDGLYSLYTPEDYFDVEGQPGNSFLEWKVDKTLLSSVYNFTGSTMTYDPLTWDYLKVDVTDAAATPTPIPGAVWLLGSGLAGLFALRRKARNAH